MSIAQKLCGLGKECFCSERMNGSDYLISRWDICQQTCQKALRIIYWLPNRNARNKHEKYFCEADKIINVYNPHMKSQDAKEKEAKRTEHAKNVLKVTPFNGVVDSVWLVPLEQRNG